jgi:hypothetical protein
MTHDHSAWDWFDEQSTHRVSSTVEPQELHKAFARFLASPEAETVLTHLHAITRNRIFGPDVGEPVLRYVEGQKALIAYMERMATAGRGNHTKA